jgi:hypothetical protein
MDEYLEGLKGRSLVLRPSEKGEGEEKPSLEIEDQFENIAFKVKCPWRRGRSQ